MTVDPTIANICKRIRQLRVQHSGERGRAKFAKDLGISPSTYNYYESTRIPPADVLVKIADLARADLRWLLTGEESPTAIPAGHPAVVRAAKLLQAHPDAERPLTAFLDLLAQTFAFPAKVVKAEPPAMAAGSDMGATAVKKVSRAQAFEAAEAKSASMRNAEHAVSIQPQRQGWIPILGRSAAGVPHFWRDAEDSGTEVTRLRDLVGTFRPRPARHVHPAEAVGELSGDETAAQLVLLDSPESPGTAEFVVAEQIARRFDPVFAVRIDGRSMEPDICHGDVVVLSPHSPAEQGKPAVVQLVDQIGVTCKLYRLDSQGVHLIPINEQFSPQVFSEDQVVWALKVLARIRSLD